MRVSAQLILVLAAFFSLTTFSGEHDADCKSHCHRQEGHMLYDWPEMKDKATCKKNGGRWRHHHYECHTKTKPPVDMKNVADRHDCFAQGGVWSDYAHDLSI